METTSSSTLRPFRRAEEEGEDTAPNYWTGASVSFASSRETKELNHLCRSGYFYVLRSHPRASEEDTHTTYTRIQSVPAATDVGRRRNTKKSKEEAATHPVLKRLLLPICSPHGVRRNEGDNNCFSQECSRKRKIAGECEEKIGIRRRRGLQQRTMREVACCCRESSRREKFKSSNK